MTVQLSQLAVQRFVDNNGNALAGGQLYTYQAGTSTLQPTYTDSTGLTPNTNPIVLNARGEANVWVTSGQAYKFALYDSLNNLIWTVDNIIDSGGALAANLASTTNATLGSTLVGWFKSLANFVGRTLSAKLSDQYSVCDYGAVGDGATNNATFLANCPATDLLVPPGTYLVNSNTTIAANLRFAAGAILRPASGVAITLSAPFTAPPTQIFDTSLGGTVAVSGLQLEPYVNWWGTKGDGVTDDTPAFTAALAALPGREVRVLDPKVNYVVKTTLTLTNNTVLVGQGKFSTKIFKSGNNDMFSIGDGAGFRDIWLDGQGAKNTGGRGILIGSLNTGDGHQNLMNARVINFPADCVAFTNVNAGSQFNATNCEFNQYGATTGSNRFAVTIVDAAQPSAVPKSFVGCEFEGAPSFNFGGSNDIFISGCFLGDLNYTLNSRSVEISNSRIANQAALSIYGHNHTIVGCDVNPQITITSGADNCHIGPNSLNNAPVIDSSGNGRNQIYQWGLSYTPTLTTAGSAPSLGNGTLTGRWSRQGALVTVAISLTLGSTTSLGSGQIGFSLPQTCLLDISQFGAAYLTHSGTIYTGVAVIPSASGYVYLARDTSGAVTFNSPATFANGDALSATFSYIVGI